ncbi:hypothetical protein HH212_07685 [Massilia forsythiae]|uniref:Uncharacterized protein n=1 Tax=Massilia forsythiae TaxID=2728020 RepID=A0A7Z2VVX9_9BURK|nr:hypothetical protein [Massilia forsythiae]QJD99914.1 hypothetical protein HH212_07685 [Massilia forsythiae]
MSKQKGPNGTRARGKETTMTVAEGSQQPRAPGWVAPGGANVQSANVEQQGAALRARGSLQGGIDSPAIDRQRGGAAAQQAGWSARQSAQRMQARGEEDRLNASRQSGDGGSEQDPSAQPVSDSASRPGRKDPGAGRS